MTTWHDKVSEISGDHSWAYLGGGFTGSPPPERSDRLSVIKSYNCREILPNSMQCPRNVKPHGFFLAASLRSIISRFDISASAIGFDQNTCTRLLRPGLVESTCRAHMRSE